MKSWYSALQARERRVVALGGTAAVALLLYVSAIEPFRESLDEARQRVQRSRALVAWMQQAVDRVGHLQGASQPRKIRKPVKSLLSVIDETVRDVGLKETLKRLAPDGSDRVRLWFEKAEFDKVIVWLVRLESEYGIEAAEISVQREAEQGLVRISMAMRKPTG